MTDAQPLPRLDMGRVVRRMLGVTASNFPAFLTLAFLFCSVPGYALGLAADYAMLSLTPYLGNPVFAFFAGYTRAYLVGIPSYISAGVITYGALQTFDGGRAKLGEYIMFGIRKSVPLLLVGLCASIVALAGLVLLIIPGFIAAIALFLVAPAVAIEKAGVFEALKRSAQLTRNNRWRMFWLLLAGSLLSGGLSAFVSHVYVEFFVPDVSPHPLNIDASFAWVLQWLVFGSYAILDVVSALLAAALVASIYYELRTLKEGVFSNQLARIFD